MKLREEWAAFSAILSQHSPEESLMGNAIKAIAYLSIPERKELLKISRTSRHPYYNIHASSLKLADRQYENLESDLRCVY
jgi:hypothetical protein